MEDVFSYKQHSVFGAGLIGCYLGGGFTVLAFQTALVCLPRVRDKLNSGMKTIEVSAHKHPIVLCLAGFVFSLVAPKARSSRWWDVSQGKLTKIEYLNLAILKYTKFLDISCPANKKITSLITQLSREGEFTTEKKPPIAPETLLIWVS